MTSDDLAEQDLDALEQASAEAIANATGASNVEAETTVSVQAEMSLDADYDLSNSDDIYALRLAIAQAYGVPIEYIQLGSSSSRRRLSMHSVSPVRAAAATPERYLGVLAKTWKRFGRFVATRESGRAWWFLPRARTRSQGEHRGAKARRERTFSSPPPAIPAKVGAPARTTKAPRGLSETLPQDGMTYVYLDVMLPRFILVHEDTGTSHFVAERPLNGSLPLGGGEGRRLLSVSFSFSITFPKDEVDDALEVAGSLESPDELAAVLNTTVETTSEPALAVEMTFVAPIMDEEAAADSELLRSLGIGHGQRHHAATAAAA